MITRADRKADYYRRAVEFAVNTNAFHATSDGMRVLLQSTDGVSLCEDGAYVDAVIWVPRRVMEEGK